MYDRVYGRRSGSETANNVIERGLHGRRASATTIDRQYLVMLGHAHRPQRLRRLAPQTRNQQLTAGPPQAA